ncbi:MAG: MFS transporter [Acidimicrobiales bacterium]
MTTTRVRPNRTIHDRRWWTLAVLCLSLLIVIVGNSSLNVTLPTLARDLHATTSQLQWVVAIYSLVFAGLLLTAGALGDRFGRKGALQAGLALFLVGAALATASQAMWQLIASRAVMGVAAAFVMPSTLSILVNVFPPGERARAIAIWASITGAGGALGPVASGYLLGHFWYGSVFLINVPIVVLALVAGRVLVPPSRDPLQARLDPLGAALSMAGLGALVYGLIEAPGRGWLSPMSLGTFAASVIVLMLFVWWERRTDEPMLDVRFFSDPAFSVGTGGMILVFFALFGMFFVLTQYFQLVLGYSPLSSALRGLPYAIVMITVSPSTPRITGRFGAHRVVGAGMLLLAGGMFLFAGVSTHTSYLYIVACIVPMATGMALSMSPMTGSIMSAVPARRAGAGSAMNDAARELGGSLGVAVLGSILSSRYTSRLHAVAAALPPPARRAATASLGGALRAASSLPPDVGRTLTAGARHGFVDGLRSAVTLGGVLALAAAAIVVRYLPPATGGGAAAQAPTPASQANPRDQR